MRSGLRYAAAFAAGLIVAGAVGLAVASDHLKRTSRSDGTPIYSLRPTGVGLPLVGAHGTLGAGQYAEALKEYHESGRYEEDLGRVGSRAHGYLRKRVRALRAAPGKLKEKPAVVLDIDETSVSNYQCLAANDFTNAVGGNFACIAANTEPPIEPTLRIYRTAVKKKVGVFFITGRPESIPRAREQTALNLRTAGYEEWKELILAPDLDVDTIAYKSGERARIEKRGWRIILNLGDQESDLRGGHADRAFKLPNPYYFIGP
jgi:HAD superfamily, subfamily IIIB (Acid phosphatase)